MHPLFCEQLAHARLAELRAAAARHRRVRAVAVRRPLRIRLHAARQAVGYRLVEFGLRLVVAETKAEEEGVRA